MTINVNITNTDSRPGAIVKCSQTDSEGKRLEHGQSAELDSGESQEFYVTHDTGLEIVEVRQP